MSGKIALLGWGSLLWETGGPFDTWHDAWVNDGPLLRIEFSRISRSRHGALTLVIDPKNGIPTTVAYCLSRRLHIAEVVEDLRKRECTTSENIGTLLRTGKAHCRDRASEQAIFTWCVEQQMDGVVWTDLRSNFTDKAGQPFSTSSALSYLRSLSPKRKARALEYFTRAPDFVQTPLRAAAKGLG